MNQALEGIHEIQEIRSKAVNIALMAFGFLAIPALIASLARALDIGWQNVFYFHIIVVLLVWLTAAFRNRLSYRIRSLFILSILLAIGIIALLNTYIPADINNITDSNPVDT